MSMNRPISLASEVLAPEVLASLVLAILVLERIPRPYLLFLEELIRRDGHGHFPRLRVNEISQREDGSVDDADDDGDGRQKAEQAGHQRASGDELTIESSGWARLTR